MAELNKSTDELITCINSVFPVVTQQTSIQIKSEFVLHTYIIRLPPSLGQFAVEFPCVPAAYSFRNAFCIPLQTQLQDSRVNLERRNETENVQLDLVLSEECDFDLLDLNLITLEERNTFNAARLASIPNLFAEDLVHFAAGRPDLLTIKIYTKPKSRARRDKGDYDYYNFYDDEKPFAQLKSPTLVLGIESKCGIVISSARIPRASKRTSSWRAIDGNMLIPFAIKSVRGRHLIGAGNGLYRSVFDGEIEIELDIHLLDRHCRISSSSLSVELDPPNDFLDS